MGVRIIVVRKALNLQVVERNHHPQPEKEIAILLRVARGNKDACWCVKYQVNEVGGAHFC